MSRLFFYGTLMSDGHRGHVLKGLARPVGTATVRGDLYNVGSGYFPALVAGDGVVHGEVWEALPGKLDAALRITDQIEGYREDAPTWSMYLRERIALLCPDCEGTGQFVINADWPDGDKPYSEPCPTCDGLGESGEEVFTYRWNHGRRDLGSKLTDGRWRNSELVG